MYEAEPFGLYPPTADYIFPGNWAVQLEFFNQAISRHRLTAAALPKKASGRDCLLAMLHAWAANKDALVMGDKLTNGHARLPQIARVFPEADFIVIWRDPLDSCRSVVQAARQNRFFGRKGILTETFFGGARLAEGVLKLRLAGRRVHETVYPELVQNPEAELRKICGFVGLEFDERMLDLKGADYSMLPPGKHHERLRSGVVGESSTRAEVLPAEFLAKGRRYAALWREHYSGLAFARALPLPPSVVPPADWEQWLDQGIYQGWRSLTDLKYQVIRQLPFPVWQRLRREVADDAQRKFCHRV